MRSLRLSSPLTLLALGTLALLSASFVLASLHHVENAVVYMRNGKVNFAGAEKFWEHRIRTEGDVRAYRDLLAFSSEISSGEGHSFAHAFGEALYRTEGVSAVSVCGQELFWGCFHQFVGEAIADHGLDIVPQLEKSCVPSGVARTECEHGLGHGLLGYLGYSLENLKSALAQCDLIEPGRPRNGCSEGVIMEYDLRELAASETAGLPKARPITEGFYSPCLDLPTRYQSTCGFDLPIWWGAQAATYAKSLATAFDWIGAHCESAPTTTLKRSCEEGLGFAAYLTHGAAGARYCASTALGAGGQRECRAAFAGSMHPTDAAAAQTACAAIGAPNDEYCARYALTDERDRAALAAP